LNLGGENLLMPHDGVSLIEWADVIQPLLPENTIEIKFSRLKNQPNVRMINIKGI
jgi:tRNA A37 threonylcarbamoyladenosine biosynthesis protein TsaE